MVEGETLEHMLARVSLVDFEGRTLYDAFVKPQERVIDYRTPITGIDADVLRKKGEPFATVRAKCTELMKGKVVVGHAVHHDFAALKLEHPAEFIRDTSRFPPLRPPKRKSTPSLRLLAEYWLEKTMQTGAHSSIEDARTTMVLYKKFQKEWESNLLLANNKLV
jgi:RNA exonuclease 4